MSINTTENRYSAIRREAERRGAFFEVTRLGVVASTKQRGATVVAAGRNIDDAAARLVADLDRTEKFYEPPRRLVGYDRAAFLTI